MNSLYIFGLAGILILFMWKKYISYTKQRNQYIQYLQAQVYKLTQQTSEQKPSSPTAPQQQNYNATIHINDNCAPELDCELNIYDVEDINNLSDGAGDVIKVEEVGNRVVVDDEDLECPNIDFETPENPEKIPLCSNEKETDVEENCLTIEEVGKCCPDPLLSFNYTDVPDTLFDKASISVSENDTNTDVKAHNADDNRVYVPKGVDTDCSDDDDDDDNTSVDEPQVKQMHCTAMLSSGKRKGMMCQRKTHLDDRCRIHTSSK